MDHFLIQRGGGLNNTEYHRKTSDHKDKRVTTVTNRRLLKTLVSGVFNNKYLK